MLDNDIIRTLLIFLLLLLFFWLLLQFILDWKKDEKVRVRGRRSTNLDDGDDDTSMMMAATPVAKKKAVQKKEPTIVDDLTKIEGIGPKISAILNEAGIVSFSDLEATDPKAIERLLEKAGSRFRMHDPGSWPKQASFASLGDWEGLDKLQEKLVAGRK